jgi:putative flavoprotein involved in K+ transport
MADFLESYAAHFDLPVRTGIRVDKLSRQGDRFLITAGEKRFEAENVVVAMATFQRAKVPAFARDFDPAIVQLHSSDYKNPAQLRDGSVLVAGAGNSGAEIAVELARNGHQTLLSGRDVGHVPFPIDGLASRLFLLRLVFRLVFHRVLTVDTPIGRKVRPKVLYIGGPLIRTRPGDLARVGVKRVPRVAGARGGRPLLADDSAVDVANVIWCTGFQPGFSWIDLPLFDEHGQPTHERGIVATEPGLYFVGLHFLYALSSTMIHGVGRDAERIATAIARRVR